MPRANQPAPFSNLRPIEGTPYETTWDGEAATCTFDTAPATHVVDKATASPYSSTPNRRRTYRLCETHAATRRAALEEQS